MATFHSNDLKFLIACVKTSQNLVYIFMILSFRYRNAIHNLMFMFLCLYLHFWQVLLALICVMGCSLPYRHYACWLCIHMKCGLITEKTTLIELNFFKLLQCIKIRNVCTFACHLPLRSERATTFRISFASISWGHPKLPSEVAFLFKSFVPRPNLHWHWCILKEFFAKMQAVKSYSAVFEHTLTHKTPFHFQWIAFLYLKG